MHRILFKLRANWKDKKEKHVIKTEGARKEKNNRKDHEKHVENQ